VWEFWQNWTELVTYAGEQSIGNQWGMRIAIGTMEEHAVVTQTTVNTGLNVFKPLGLLWYLSHWSFLWPLVSSHQLIANLWKTLDRIFIYHCIWISCLGLLDIHVQFVIISYSLTWVLNLQDIELLIRISTELYISCTWQCCQTLFLMHETAAEREMTHPSLYFNCVRLFQ
jgi:hypothetical protein